MSNEVDKTDTVDNLTILKYLLNIDKKISNLEYDLTDLKERVYKDELPTLSSCPWGQFAGIDERQLDIDEENFDKAWFLKHYKVDCPEYDLPLSISSFIELGYTMTPEEYGKYIAEFNAADKGTTEVL